MLDKKLIERINNETDIVSLVGEFVSLEKKGKNFLGLCPFHDEKTPSFSVSPEKNIAKCMSCQEGGRPVTFFQKVKNISKEEAVFELASRLGIAVSNRVVTKDVNEVYYQLLEETAQFYVFNLHKTQSGKAVLSYLKERNISDESIEHFQIGYSGAKSSLYEMLKDKGYKVSDMMQAGIVKQNERGEYYDLFMNRLMFPIKNEKGRVVGFSGRAILPGESIKYINSPESKVFKKGETIYHLFESLSDIRKKKEVVLFEGFFDVIQSYQAGIKHGIATMGTALTKQQAQMIRSYAPKVLIIYDGDQAGQKATAKAIPILRQERLIVSAVTLPNRLDPDDYVKKHGSESYQTYIRDHTQDSYQFLYDYYKTGKNFTNANDITTFKNDVFQMLKYADEAIVKVYQNKLSEDLNIDIGQLMPKKPLKETPVKKKYSISNF